MNMSLLLPSLQSITHAYTAWLDPPGANDLADVSTASNDTVHLDTTQLRAEAPPPWVTDAIRRQTQVKPLWIAPREGALVLLPAPAGAAADSLPLLAILDTLEGDSWHAWLVTPHTDYAGCQDVVLEGSLFTGEEDPLPLAGMVESWNPLWIPNCDLMQCLHMLKPEALQAIRSIALIGGRQDDVAPQPGHMQLRDIEGCLLVTGTPLGEHDPRSDYLLFCRRLAASASEHEPGLQQPEVKR